MQADAAPTEQNVPRIKIEEIRNFLISVSNIALINYDNRKTIIE